MQPPRNIKELLLRDNIFEKRRKTFENGIKRVAFFARIVYNTNDAEMAERSNAHDSKSCYAGMYTRVQIPFSAPSQKMIEIFRISVVFLLIEPIPQ